VNFLSKFFIQTYSSAAATTAAKLTSKVRRQAYDMGWPPSVSRHLVIAHKDGEYVVEYPQQIKESVLNLEYGNQKTPPLPLMRTFIRGITDTGMRQEVEKSLKDARFTY
jgi:hypothetical protein